MTRAPATARSGRRSATGCRRICARDLYRFGYGNLILKRVASEAGYTGGALFHQFRDKEDLALAVLDWLHDNWMREVGDPARQEPDPVAELIALARGHGVFCRRDVARVVMALQVEFSGQDHPVGRASAQISDRGVKRVVRLIDAGRKAGDDSTRPAGQGGRVRVLRCPGGHGDPGRWTGAPR
jgi:AcrR family transcriptional regulator